MIREEEKEERKMKRSNGVRINAIPEGLEWGGGVIQRDNRQTEEVAGGERQTGRQTERDRRKGQEQKKTARSQRGTATLRPTEKRETRMVGMF